ncbi:glycosyltransferase [Halomarina salina]|uniref:Glycosyltransferase n=1 Tax=Halomarina salina TaxID=1872699 RepID=A0ABD5RH15_9EURY|nr:glycosyltransferase [Halomarina salina]
MGTTDSSPETVGATGETAAATAGDERHTEETPTGTASADDPIEVCLLTNHLAPDGAPTLLLEIVTGSDSPDISFTVCSFGGDDELGPAFEEAGATVVDLGSSMSVPQFDPLSIPRALRFFRTAEFDVLHCHMPYSHTVGRVLGAAFGVDTIVSTQHNVPDNYHPVERAGERLTRFLDSTTVAVSEGVENAFTGRSELHEPGTTPEWCTIRNGIDVEAFHRKVAAADGSAVRATHDLDDETVFLNVARYEPQKAQVDLVTAMGRVVESLPDAHLFVVGWGSAEEDIRDEVARLGIGDSVTVTGRVPTVHEYYAAADVFVSSSIFEGLPITHLEAMAAELPIVTTDIPGVREVVLNGETGQRVPIRSPAELAEAMTTVATSDGRDAMGRAGYQRALDAFSIEDTVASHLRLYRDLHRQHASSDAATDD